MGGGILFLLCSSSKRIQYTFITIGETRSVTMNTLHGTMKYLIKTGEFSLVRIYLRPSKNSRQLIFNINAVVLIDIIC